MIHYKQFYDWTCILIFYVNHFGSYTFQPCAIHCKILRIFNQMFKFSHSAFHAQEYLASVNPFRLFCFVLSVSSTPPSPRKSDNLLSYVDLPNRSDYDKQLKRFGVQTKLRTTTRVWSKQKDNLLAQRFQCMLLFNILQRDIMHTKFIQ